MQWSETESKDYLMWSLEGKALDFFTITSDIEKYSFRKIIKKTRGQIWCQGDDRNIQSKVSAGKSEAR